MMKTPKRILSIGTVIGFMIALPAIVSAETYTYDATGRLTVVTYDDGSTLTYTYDNAGNIIQQLAAHGVAIGAALFRVGLAVITGSVITAVTAKDVVRRIVGDIAGQGC